MFYCPFYYYIPCIYAEFQGTTHVYACKLGYPNPLVCPWVKLMDAPEHKISETTDSKKVKNYLKTKS